MSIKLNMIKKY